MWRSFPRKQQSSAGLERHVVVDPLQHHVTRRPRLAENQRVMPCSVGLLGIEPMTFDRRGGEPDACAEGTGRGGNSRGAAQRALLLHRRSRSMVRG